MKILFAVNLYKFDKPESLGIVRDTHFVRCYWPRLDMPTPLFADGSSGLMVSGPPIPRNIIFPPGTIFGPFLVNDAKLTETPRWRQTSVPTRADCYYSREIKKGVVIELVEVTRTLEVKKGVFAEAKFMEEQVVNKDIEIVHELDLEQAAQVANIDRIKIEPIIVDKL